MASRRSWAAEPGLLALIDAHTDDDAVEEGQRALHDAGMPHGEGVERPGEYGCLHIVACFGRLWGYEVMRL